MPQKFNGAGRYSFEEAPYGLKNWPAYTESLRQRGEVTIGLSREVKAAWRAGRCKIRCAQPVYSDQIIPTCLTLAVVYKQPLQQSDEALRRLVKLIGEDIRLPDFFIFSRRGFVL